MMMCGRTRCADASRHMRCCCSVLSVSSRRHTDTITNASATASTNTHVTLQPDIRSQTQPPFMMLEGPLQLMSASHRGHVAGEDSIPTSPADTRIGDDDVPRTWPTSWTPEPNTRTLPIKWKLMKILLVRSRLHMSTATSTPVRVRYASFLE